MAQLLLCSLILIQASANDDILGDYNPGEHHDQSARKAHQKTHGTKLVKFEADTIAALGPGILGGDRALHGSNSDEVGLAVGRDDARRQTCRLPHHGLFGSRRESGRFTKISPFDRTEDKPPLRSDRR